MRDGWLPSVEFAELAGVNRRVANRLLAAFVAGRSTPWRGAHLEVREVSGRGGRAGIRYEVKVSSLPQDLQEQLKASKTPLQLSLSLPLPSV